MYDSHIFGEFTMIIFMYNGFFILKLFLEKKELMVQRSIDHQ